MRPFWPCTVSFCLLLCLTAAAQMGGMAGMDESSMPGMVHPDLNAAHEVNSSMAGQMSMGPHMVMTELAKANPADRQRAEQLVQTLRRSLEKYKDYHVALDEGFKPFLPNVPQKVYHFTNYGTAFMEYLSFRPAHPGSLLYEKTHDGYRLVGAMYSAPADSTLDELDERVPLSVARWHEHVNLCVPPKGHNEMWRRTEHGKPLFGPAGTIATKPACDAAGGNWLPHLFGWMVHVYPFADGPSSIWSTNAPDGD